MKKIGQRSRSQAKVKGVK